MNIIKKLLLIITATTLTAGCSLTKDTLENSTIYATTYPIEYLTEFLYKDYASIESIYPNGADIENYELTEKQINKYSTGDLFIYNGLDNEKNIAKNLINKNKNLLIIDVSNGLTYMNDSKELWLSPNNYLMLAKNIKDNLEEYLTSKVIMEHVNQKYNELAEILSLKDAELREIGKHAKESGRNTLVVNDNVFKFLENYDFNIVSLDEETLTESSYAAIENNFKKKNYKTIYILDNITNEKIDSIINTYDVKTIKVNSMTIIDENDDENNYLTIMQTFIDNIRNNCLNN